MSLIKIDGVQSLSAPTKAQKDAAIYMLGSKGHAIVSVLDKLSRAKEIRAPHLDGLLKLMKDGTDEEIIKFVASAAGKKTLLNAKAFATAKTLTASIKALRLIRVPQKWIEGHSDAAAARINETKEIRARRTAGNKPEKPIKLDNPQAPESTTVDGSVIDAKKGSATPAKKAKATTTFTFVKSKNAGGGAIELQFRQPGNGHEWSLVLRRQKDLISSEHQGSSGYQTAESFLQRGVIAVGGSVINEHQQPNSASFQFASENQAKAFMSWLKSRKPRRLTSRRNRRSLSPKLLRIRLQENQMQRLWTNWQKSLHVRSLRSLFKRVKNISMHCVTCCRKIFQAVVCLRYLTA